jgi:hypothetical protein
LTPRISPQAAGKRPGRFIFAFTTGEKGNARKKRNEIGDDFYNRVLLLTVYKQGGILYIKYQIINRQGDAPWRGKYESP